MTSRWAAAWLPLGAGARGALAALVGLLGTAAAAPPRDEVVLHFLANEGYAIEAGGQTVLVDALHTVGRPERGELPPELHRRMLEGRPPFRRVRLVLVSHPHADHLDPEVAAAFLKRHPESVLASSREVLERLRRSPHHPSFRDRLRELPAAPATWSGGDVRVTAFPLPHVGSHLFPEPVLAHLLEVGGLRILHVGDAELADDHLAGLELRSRNIDVAVLPYWALVREGAPERMSRLVGSRKIVAMRLPVASLAAARERVKKAFPQALILSRPLESARLGARAPR
ncbi:MAG: MBL fold metallo-hydrolase [Deltaproteobacteria bacterium]|nr:MBL fold metallo-hydrolase [Deltaproteobacteria bacterium]